MNEGAPHLTSLTLLKELIKEAGLNPAHVLDPAPLSWSTGLPEHVVKAGLGRRRLPDTDLTEQVAQRLEFLRRTRRRADGSQFTRAEIGHAAGVTQQWIGEILNGRKLPKLEHAALIEDFFHVPRGFLTATPSQALDRALREKLEVEQAHWVAGLKEKYQLRTVAFRGPPERLAEKLAAMKALMDEIVADDPGA
ncbi:helix-turn-helix domain-containing protein [Streptomyces sp. 12297]